MFPADPLLWIGLPGLDPASALPGLVPGGVVLFARNLDMNPSKGPARCHRMIQELQASWGHELPLAVAIDQEGGRVSRLAAWVGETPTLHRIWTREGAAGARAWGLLWGEGLRLLGFNVDFAPPVDLYDGIPGTGLGERCASADPDEVAQAAGAFLEGLESQGVFGCLKHFPGLGSTRVDSHKELPEIMDPAQIERGLRPFRALARPGRLVMVGHVRTPWSEGRPASLHRAHVAGNPWGVQATWVTDDLEMGGVTPWPWPERARWAIEAGHGALLVCQTHEAQLGARAALSELPADLLAPSLDAGRQFRRQLPRPLDGPFDQAAWEAWVPRVRAAAARLA